MSESSESRFIYTMRKASNLSALSVGAADHRDLILTANGRLVHAAKLLGFGGVRGETIDVTRTRAAQYVIHHLVGVTGETYETIESWSVDEALSCLTGQQPSNQVVVSRNGDTMSNDLRHFLELANEIRNRIEENPDEWWKDICQLSEQLEESLKLICPGKAWGFILTKDSRIDDSSAEHIKKQSEHRPDFDCGKLTKDATGFVLHSPSQPMTDDRRIADDVLSQTILWTCDPYEDVGSVSVVETLCGPLGGELTAVRTPTEASEPLSSIGKWVRFAESRLRIAETAGKLQAAASSLSIPEIRPVELPDDFADSIIRPGEYVNDAPETLRNRTLTGDGNAAQGQDEAEATKPTGPSSKREQRAQWLAQAMLLVRDHPDWSDAEIARRVDKDKSTLSRSKEYQAAAAMARGVKEDRHRGHISVDPDSGLRDVEAYSDDPAERDWDT